MTVLVIGGGGREHAVGWALAKSERVSKLYFAPGNAGTAQLGENIPVAATDLDGVLEFCRKMSPDLIAVVPDDPLSLGMVDILEANGFAAFGPTKAAAKIEWSKEYSKDFMRRHGVPTAEYTVTHGKAAAAAQAEACGLPVVIKADGLALGKGVIICHTRQQALDAAETLGAAASGQTLLFEDFLTGPEVTQLCFSDGKTVSLMPASQDHKRAFDGDNGPNTGGMGAFTPVSVYTDAVRERCMNEIFLPTLRGLEADGTPFRGVLYISLMLTPRGPMVIEYNSRFGDPEAQAVLPLLESDLAEIFMACRNGTLCETPVRWKNAACCCVVMASGGYPGSYEKGKVISGLDAARSSIVFHAGTALRGSDVVTSGGRVLGVSAVAPTLRQAVAQAYADTAGISFDGAFYRSDIARKDEMCLG